VLGERTELYAQHGGDLMNMNEIRFRLLEKITVNNYAPDTEYIRVASYGNEYYLLEHYEAVKDKLIELGDGYYTVKEGISINVVRVENEDELLSAYINSFLTANLNPFKVLLLYKKHKLSVEPRLQHILEQNKDIPDNILTELSEQLEQLESRKLNARVVIDVSILEAVRETLRLFEEYREVLEKAELYKDRLKARNLNIRDIIFESVKIRKDSITYPTYLTVIAKTDEELAMLTKEIREIEEHLQQRTEEEREKDKEEGDEEEHQNRKQKIQVDTKGISSSTNTNTTTSVTTTTPNIQHAPKPSNAPSSTKADTGMININTNTDINTNTNVNQSLSIYIEVSRPLTVDEYEYLKQSITQILKKIDIKVKRIRISVGE